MKSKTIPFTEFQSDMRDVVLNSLDDYVKTVMDTDRVGGWKDSELNALFSGVDAHSKALAVRINDGHEVNSAYVQIDMEA